MSMQRPTVSWAEVDSFLDRIAEKYSAMNISGIYGIPRGGIVLATWLSYKMNVPLLQGAADNCIIIDDICDSGETLVHYARNSSDAGRDRGYHLVTLFYKESSSVKPESYGFVKGDQWVIFPWEV